jgi:hypothetical protein
MRSVGRIYVASQDSGVGTQSALAQQAERLGLDGIWVQGTSAGHGDSYATTTAAAIASLTRDIRLGVILRLEDEGDILRVAEDIAVIDHCSSGRVELWLECPPEDGARWISTAERLLKNLRVCSAGEHEVPVTPGPLQPQVPVVTRGAPSALADAGVVVELDGSASRTDHRGRTTLCVRPDRTQAAVAAAGLPTTLLTAVESLRAAIDSSGAHDVVFVLPEGFSTVDVEIVASVIAPILRAIDHEVADLVLDTLKFRSASKKFGGDVAASELLATR